MVIEERSLPPGPVVLQHHHHHQNRRHRRHRNPPAPSPAEPDTQDGPTSSRVGLRRPDAELVGPLRRLDVGPDERRGLGAPEGSAEQQRDHRGVDARLAARGRLLGLEHLAAASMGSDTIPSPNIAVFRKASGQPT